MKIRNVLGFILSCFLLAFVSNCACEEDEFGEVLHMEIPVDIGGERNLFQVGDTLWVKADFPKEVVVVGSSSRIELTDYKFFSELFLSEISDLELRFFSTLNVLVEIGDVTLNQLGGYDYVFENTGAGYTVRFGIILSQAGTFSSTFLTDGDAQSELDQEEHYVCGDNRRTNIFIDRINRFSTMENFNEFNEWNRVGGGSFVQTYEGYRRAGKFTFRVVE